MQGTLRIEDHHFVDPRFVLAGYELDLHYEGREVPVAFWEGYGRFKPVPASEAQCERHFRFGSGQCRLERAELLEQPGLVHEVIGLPVGNG
jgi:hypothetical protein